MSKSLGNGVDPMDVIDKYGADSLRYFLTTNTASGMDLRYDEEKVKSTWNFINKLWNASRYVLLTLEDFREDDYTFDNLTIQDKWILTKLNKTILEVRRSMDKYDFNIVGNTLYSFIWSDFCDKYIELSKFNPNKTTKSVLIRVLTDILKMMHPFMPYVTEEIYGKLPIKDAESIMISKYPTYNELEVFNDDEILVDDALEFITMFRNRKVELHLGNDFQVDIKISNSDVKTIIINMLKLNDKMVSDKSDLKEDVISYKDLEIKLYYDNTENEMVEKANLEKEYDRLVNSIKRREKLLSNDNYVNKAPSNIVLNERNQLKLEQEQLEMIKNKLSK